MSLLIGCGGQSLLPGMPTFPSIPPTPSANNQPTGSSPMSGDWIAQTTFGRFAFTVDPTGENVTTSVVNITNFTCGGTTLTTELQTINTWPIMDSQFSAAIDLNPGHIEDLSIDAKFDPKTKKFSGTWEDDEYGTHCSGTWETPARK
jgi:hypothetical protein